jgi:hypothetical protein
MPAYAVENATGPMPATVAYRKTNRVCLGNFKEIWPASCQGLGATSTDLGEVIVQPFFVRLWINDGHARSVRLSATTDPRQPIGLSL